MVPVYTRVLATGSYGRASELLAYVAILQVVLIFGLETGFFRFANKHKDKSQLLYTTSVAFVTGTSVIFLLLVILFSGKLGNLMGYPGKYLIYIAIILAIDCLTAVMFTKLRFDNRPWKFAAFRSIKILSEVAFNLVLFFTLPHYLNSHPDSWILHFLPAYADYGYILMAIMLSCFVALFLFLPEIIRTSYKFSGKELRQLLTYSFPLMVAGLPGVANDFISRILFRFYAPVSSPWDDQLGIFSANIKLAVFMVLFVQMFRYAAEPFFFSSAHKEDMKKTYADVMRYFVVFCMFIFLFVGMLPDLFALFIGKDYRSGIGVLPIMLIANVLLGINFNLSMWYKLSEQTRYAVYVTLTGLLITFVFSVLFMPVYGYYAAAWGYLFSYLVMVLINIYLGNRFYPIPYNWRSISVYFFSGIIIYLAYYFISPENIYLRLLLAVSLMTAYLVFVFKKERLHPKSLVTGWIRNVPTKNQFHSHES